MRHRLRELRKALGLKQKEFGKKINLSDSCISDYERGRREIIDRSIDDICTKFNVNKEWFKTGEGEMFIDVTSTPEFEQFDDFTNDLIRKIQSLNEKDQRIIESMVNTMCEEEKKEEN